MTCFQSRWAENATNECRWAEWHIGRSPYPTETTPVPDLVSKAMTTLNGYDAKLVIPKKTLFASDLDTKQSRLNLNVKLMNGFLSQDEQKTLSAKRSVGLRVAVLVAVHPPSKIRVIELHKREKNYSFVKGWKKLIADNANRLNVDESFSLYGFRSRGVQEVVRDCEGDNLCDLDEGSICFAIVPSKDSGNDDLPGETESALPGQTESALPAETEPTLPGETKSDLPGQTKSADWFNESHEFNHLSFDPNDREGYLPEETEDFGVNEDGSIRDA
ncbi:PREDICTED: putative B3 domain-containing protein At2g31460 [Camelina sativa]|uniref:B3 domain-containing protein At2g31460 n=1 Tax=Camelina sativa TaxID=90675 RepID=A0ABM0T065_CAMSA|nr:PREDICTED: putative B3 domain-containing protein At2g31460 [Camelina sativa]